MNEPLKQRMDEWTATYIRVVVQVHSRLELYGFAYVIRSTQVLDPLELQFFDDSNLSNDIYLQKKAPNYTRSIFYQNLANATSEDLLLTVTIQCLPPTVYLGKLAWLRNTSTIHLIYDRYILGYIVPLPVWPHSRRCHSINQSCAIH